MPGRGPNSPLPRHAWHEWADASGRGHRGGRDTLRDTLQIPCRYLVIPRIYPLASRDRLIRIRAYLESSRRPPHVGSAAEGRLGGAQLDAAGFVKRGLIPEGGSGSRPRWLRGPATTDIKNAQIRDRFDLDALRGPATTEIDRLDQPQAVEHFRTPSPARGPIEAPSLLLHRRHRDRLEDLPEHTGSAPTSPREHFC